MIVYKNMIILDMKDELHQIKMMMPKTNRCLAHNKHVKYIRENYRDSIDHLLFTYNSNRYGVMYTVLLEDQTMTEREAPLGHCFIGLWIR